MINVFCATKHLWLDVSGRIWRHAGGFLQGPYFVCHLAAVDSWITETKSVEPDWWWREIEELKHEWEDAAQYSRECGD